MRVIVTRPAEQATPFVERLRGLGVDAVALPLLTIEPAPDRALLQALWQELDRLALVMFVSANAVAHFVAARPAGRPWPEGVHAGSTGPGTSAALRAAGVPQSLIDEPPPEGPFDTDTLWQRLRTRDWHGRRVCVVRGEDGRDWLAEQLRDAGAELRFVAAYRRVAPRWSAEQVALVDQALADPARHGWHFSSSEALGHLLQARAGADWSASLAWATHARIAARAREAGFGQVHELAPGAEALAQWLRRRDAEAPSIESRPL